MVTNYTKVDVLSNYIDNGLKNMNRIYPIKTELDLRKKDKLQKTLSANSIALEILGMKDYFINDICIPNGMTKEQADESVRKYDMYIIYIDMLQSQLGMRHITPSEAKEYRKNNKSKIFTNGKISNSVDSQSPSERAGCRIMERVVPSMRYLSNEVPPEKIEDALGKETNAVGLIRKNIVYSKSFEQDNIEKNYPLSYTRHVPQYAMSIIRYFYDSNGSIYNILQEKDSKKRSENFVRLIWLDMETRKLGFQSIKDFFEGVFELGGVYRKGKFLAVPNMDESVTLYFKSGGHIITSSNFSKIVSEIGDKVSLDQDGIAYDVISEKTIWSLVYKNVYKPINGNYNDLREINLTK